MKAYCLGHFIFFYTVYDRSTMPGKEKERRDTVPEKSGGQVGIDSM